MLFFHEDLFNVRLGSDGWYCVTKGKPRSGFLFELSGELHLFSCLQNFTSVKAMGNETFYGDAA